MLVEDPDHLLKGGFTPMQLLRDADLQWKDLPYTQTRQHEKAAAARTMRDQVTFDAP
jgi:hypothetical protein